MAWSILLGILFVAGTVGLTLAAYTLMRCLALAAGDFGTKELAGSVASGVSALHGLILALVFAQEMIDYQQLRYENTVEANAVADIYYDIERYDPAGARPVQDMLYSYVKAVTDEEWDRLGATGRLSPGAWVRWDEAYNAILNLSPGNDRQRSLRDNMLARVHAVAETRVERENHAGASVSMLFWFAAVAGVVCIALAYYSYPPKRVNLWLVSLYGAFTGLVLFFIYAFENPYSAPGRMAPDAHIRLIEQLDRARGASG